MSAVQNVGGNPVIKTNVHENHRRPPRESFCEFEIIEEYQREKRKKRNRSNSKDTDLIKKIKDLTARNAEIKELYKNLQMQKESCSNTFNSQETGTTKSDTADEIKYNTIDSKMRNNSAGQQDIKVRPKIINNIDKTRIIQIKPDTNQSTKVAEIKEILEKELLEHDKLKIRLKNDLFDKNNESNHLICQNCSGIITYHSIPNKSNQKPQLICQNCCGEIDDFRNCNYPVIKLTKSKHKQHKNHNEEIKFESPVAASVQDRIKHTTRKPNVKVFENQNLVIGTKCNENETKDKISKAKHSTTGESKIHRNRSCSPISRHIISFDKPCQVNRNDLKPDFELPLSDRIINNRKKEEILKSQLKACIKSSEKDKHKEIKVHRKELSFSKLNLHPMKDLYLNLEQPATLTISNFKITDKNRSRSKSALPVKTTLKPIIARNRSCDNETPNTEDKKCTMVRKKQQQMLPSNALKEISKVFELEKAATKCKDESSKYKSYIPRSLELNPVELKQVTQKIFANNKFHTSKIIRNERIVEVASKVLRDQQISFTVEGIEPPKKLEKNNKDRNKNFRTKDNLRIQLFHGVDLKLNDTHLLSHGSYHKKYSIADSLDAHHSSSKQFQFFTHQTTNNIPQIEEDKCSSSSHVSTKFRCKKKKMRFLRKNKRPRKYNSNEDNTRIIKTVKQYPCVIESSTQTMNFNKQEEPSSFFEDRNSVILNNFTYETAFVEKKNVAVEANLLVSDFKLSQSFECSHCEPSHLIASNLENQDCKFMNHFLNKLHFDGIFNESEKSLKKNLIDGFDHQMDDTILNGVKNRSRIDDQKLITQRCDKLADFSDEIDNNYLIRSSNEKKFASSTENLYFLRLKEDIRRKCTLKEETLLNSTISQENKVFTKNSETPDSSEFDDKNPFKTDDTPVPNIKKYAQKEIIELEKYLTELLAKISSKTSDEMPVGDFIQHEDLNPKVNTFYDTVSSSTNTSFKPVSFKKSSRRRSDDKKYLFQRTDVRSVYNNTNKFCSSSDSSIELTDISQSNTSLSTCQKSISQRYYSRDFQIQPNKKIRDFDKNRVSKRKNKSQLKSMKKLVKLKKISKQSIKEETFSKIVVLSVSSMNNLKSTSYLRKICDKLISNSVVSLKSSEAPSFIVEDKHVISKEPLYTTGNYEKVQSVKKNKVPEAPSIIVEDKHIISKEPFYMTYNMKKVPSIEIKSSMDSLELNKFTNCPLQNVFNSSKPNYTYFVYNTEVIPEKLKRNKPINIENASTNTNPNQQPNNSLTMSSFATTSQNNNSFIFRQVKRSSLPQKSTKTRKPDTINIKADTSPKIATRKSDHKSKIKKGSFSNNVSTFSDASGSTSCKNFIVKYISKGEKLDRPSNGSQAKPNTLKKLSLKNKSVLDFSSSVRNLFSNESGYDTCKTSKNNSIKNFFKRTSILDLFKPNTKRNLMKKDSNTSSVNLNSIAEDRPGRSTSSINVFNVKSSKTVLWLNFKQKKSKQKSGNLLKEKKMAGKYKIKNTSTNTPNVSHCPCLADYEAKRKECQKYGEKVLLDSVLRKEGYIKQYEEFKEIPLDILMGKGMIKSPKPKRYSDKILAKPMPTQTPTEKPSTKVSAVPSLYGFSQSSDEEEIKNHNDFINIKIDKHDKLPVLSRDSDEKIVSEGGSDSEEPITDGKKNTVKIKASDQKLTDKEVFDKLLIKYETSETIAKKLSVDEEFFQEQLSVVPTNSKISLKELEKVEVTKNHKLENSLDHDDIKVRGPRFHDKANLQTTKNECDVKADDIGTCFARGFRPDNLMLSGDACFNLNKQDKIKMSPHVLKNTESIIDFSERETPLDFLLALGFMVDEASNALKDDDIRSRLLAAITEARIWINKITTTQGTLLYLVAYKSRPDTMRYFLQLVEAIINKRINNAIKLDGFLRVLEQVEDGRIQMINILGEDKFEDEENEEKIVKKQMKHLFVNVYTIAETEAKQRNQQLTNFQISLLRILVAKYRAGLHPHLELIARYIGQGLLISEIQLEAAMIFLSRLDTADVKLKEFENYCGIHCETTKL